MTVGLAPLVSTWLRTGSSAASAPRPPEDAPVCSAAGPDPDRVLLVGSGPATDAGAPSHGLGLTGALARRLALRTGRGATVETSAGPRCSMDAVPGLLDGVLVSTFDVIVVIAGTLDVTDLRPVGSWRRALTAVLEGVQGEASHDASVLVVGAPEARIMGIAPGVRRRVADSRVRAVNAATASIAAASRRVTFVAPTDPAGVPVYSPAWYEAFASGIAEPLAGLLAARSAR